MAASLLIPPCVSLSYYFSLCLSTATITNCEGGGDLEGAGGGEEFALDSMEGGRMRRKSKRQVLEAKDVDIEKVSLVRSYLVLCCVSLLYLVDICTVIAERYHGIFLFFLFPLYLIDIVYLDCC